MRVYIAGKIGGLTEEVWSEKFAKAREEVVAMGHIAVCPTQLRHSHERRWVDYMREDLAALLTCDAVYAQRDYHDSPGATIEVNLASSLSIPIMYQQPVGGWMNEDDLPTMTEGQYAEWFRHSRVAEGVRMGPKFPYE